VLYDMSIAMAIESETKVVQTELTEQEYERLARVADREDLSLKEALQEAAREFVDRRDRHDPDDPFFASPVAPGADAEHGDEDLTATKTDTYLYE
jgi:hypothetical protein